MATERLLMRHIREILRLKWTLRRSHRETARSLGISAGAVASVVTRAKAMALTWDAVGTLSDDALERTLYGPKLALTVARPGPDLVWMHTELRRPGVTLELLHLEYLAAHPDGYRYSAFCGHYRRWLAQQRTSMRQVHTAGEKTFVDYAGQRPSLVDPATGEIVPVELFVAVLGASNYTYAEATLTQRSVDFIQSHTRTVEYFGGVSAVVVPDQLRTGVTDPCRYEPTVQRTYADWARHYGTAIVPARPAKPRDKAKVEVAVQVAERWILARLRNETFFTLAALNARIAELLTDLNDRPMKGYGGASRRALFERFDRPALQPLPRDRYVHADWRHARVNIDYHVEVDRHYYSVPHALIHAAVEICLTATTVDVLLRGARVWLHVRSYRAGSPHDHPGAHAEGAPRASGVEPLPLDRLGRHHRAPHRGARPGPAREPAPSRARLSLVPGHPAIGEAARARRGSTPPAPARSPPARGRIATSSRSSNTAWTVCPWTSSPRRRARGPCMPTSAAPRTTNRLMPKETAHAD